MQREETPAAWQNACAFHCINKADRRSAHERIKYVGGLNSDGTRWRLSVQKTIQDLESREWEYYVEESGITAEVIVATDGRHKYIKKGVRPAHDQRPPHPGDGPDWRSAKPLLKILSGDIPYTD
ncbi:DUF3892 domain-containing protein [Bradyrhizobium sp. CCBAU 65884]|uniref:DUF3892 domain-containing protein n=1 Tax=Bradyrhizobium sp. CCBAU 65884 TaxID=722477 RepID=UPI002305E4C0|nr:DUF3892 domain-containing protein [Bradyrhizobium sp. CCBAU 65884]